MVENSVDIENVFINRLQKKGIERETIPLFIRDLVNSGVKNPTVSLAQLNKRLQWLGWSGFQVDYHTFVLAIAYLENDGLKRGV
jgi:hypothetical protein